MGSQQLIVEDIIKDAPMDTIREYLADADEYGSYPTLDDFQAFLSVAVDLPGGDEYRWPLAWAETTTDVAFAVTVEQISLACKTVTATWDEYEDAWAESHQPREFWDDDPTHGTDEYDC